MPTVNSEVVGGIEKMVGKFERVACEIAAKPQQHTRTKEMPKHPLLTVELICEYLGVADDRVKAVEAVLRRLWEGDRMVRATVEDPQHGEPKYLYRVEKVWGALLEKLPRWQ